MTQQASQETFVLDTFKFQDETFSRNLSLQSAIYKPYLGHEKKKRVLVNLKLDRIRPYVVNQAQSSMEDLIRCVDTRSNLYTQTYKSFNLRNVLTKIERGEVSPTPLLLEEQQSLYRQTFHQKNSSLRQSQVKFKLPKPLPIGLTQERKSSVPLQTVNEDERVNYMKYDDDLVNKLNQGNKVQGFTKLKLEDDSFEWTQCQMISSEQDKYTIFIPKLGKTKVITRLNFMLPEEKLSEHQIRINHEIKNRKQKRFEEVFRKQLDQVLLTQDIPVDSQIIEKIHDFVFAKEPIKSLERKFQRLIENQARQHYKESLGKMYLGIHLTQNYYNTQIKRFPEYDFEACLDQMVKSYHRVGTINILKQVDHMMIMRKTQLIMSQVDYARTFCLFENFGEAKQKVYSSPVQLKESFKIEFLYSIKRLQSRLLNIEDLIDQMREYITGQVNLYSQQTLSLHSKDYMPKIKKFNDLTQKKFNFLVSSKLTISLKNSFNILLSEMTLYTSRNCQHSLITEVKNFSNTPTHIRQDLNIIINNYIQLTQLLQLDLIKDYEQLHRDKDQREFIVLTVKSTQLKKKIPGSTLFKYIKSQRGKIYDAEQYKKQILLDTLRENSEDRNAMDYLPPITVIQNRMGWFSFEKQKIVLVPQLYEYEEKILEAVSDTVQILVDQRAIGEYCIIYDSQIVSGNRLRIEESELVLNKFTHFLNHFFYDHYLFILPVIQLLNNFSFYLLEQPFINKMIKSYEQTNDPSELDQERANLMKDLNLLEISFGNTLKIGIFQLNFEELRVEIITQVKKAIAAIDQALLVQLNKLLVLNDEINTRCNNKLTAPHNKDVNKFMELKSYTLSKEFQSELKQVSDNLEKMDQIILILNKYYVPVPEDENFHYFGQLSLNIVINQQRILTIEYLDRQQEIFNEIVEAQAERLLDRFTPLVKQIKKFKTNYDTSQEQKNLSDAKQIENDLNDLLALSEQINFQQNFLHFPLSDFSEIKDASVDFSKYSDLWMLSVSTHYKIQTWDQSQVFEIDVRELMEQTRDIKFEIGELIKLHQDQNILNILNQLSMENSKYEPILQSIFVIQAIKGQPKRLEQVIKKILYNKSIQDIITVDDFLTNKVQNYQDFIIQQQIQYNHDQELINKIHAYEVSFKELLVVSDEFILDQIIIPTINNTTQILMTLQETQFDAEQFIQGNPWLLPAHKEKITFWMLVCKETSKLLKKIFFIQEVILLLTPYVRCFQKNWSNYNNLRDEISKRIESIRRTGMIHYYQYFDKGESPIIKNFQRGEFLLLKKKLKDQKGLAQDLKNEFHKEIEEYRCSLSRLSYFSNQEIACLFQDIFNVQKVDQALQKVFPNIKQFNLELNINELKILKYFTALDQEIKTSREITINMRKASKQSFIEMFQQIEEDAKFYVKDQIFTYIMQILNCNYDLEKIYSQIDVYNISFQAVQLQLQIQFYHDLTLVIQEGPVIANQRLVELRNFMIEQVRVYNQNLRLKFKTKQIPYDIFTLSSQLQLLFLHFEETISYLLERDDSTDPFMMKLNLSSFEYLSLPKFTLELTGQEDEIEYFKYKETKKILNLNPKISYVSFNNREYYSYEIQKDLDFLIITKQTQKSFFFALSLLNHNCALVFQGYNKNTTIKLLCTILAKPIVFVSENNQTSHMIGSILQRGDWAIYQNKIQSLAYLLFEIHGAIFSNQQKLKIEHQEYSINTKFRLFGCLSQNSEKGDIDSFRVISIRRTETSFLNYAFGQLLGIGPRTFKKLDSFWENVLLIFKYTEQVNNLPSLQLIFCSLIKTMRQQGKVYDHDVQVSMMQFIEKLGHKLSHSQQSLLRQLCQEEFKEALESLEKINEEQDKQYKQYAQEYMNVQPEKQLMEQIVQFMEHFMNNNQLTIVGESSRKLIDIAAYIFSKIRTVEFQLIYFPMYTISKEDMFGSSKDDVGLLKRILNSQQKEIDNNLNNCFDKVLHQQLILKHCSSKKNQPFTEMDWFVFDNPWDHEQFIKRQLCLQTSEVVILKNPSIVQLDSLHNWTPQPLQDYIICERVMSKDELFLSKINKLIQKNQFYKQIDRLLIDLHQNLGAKLLTYLELRNMVKIFKILLNELRKIYISKGLITQNQYSSDEKKLNFDAKALFDVSIPQKPIQASVEAIYIMSIIMGIRAFTPSEKYMEVSLQIQKSSQEYQDNQGSNRPFADDLVSFLKHSGLHLFDVHYNLYEQKWMGRPEFISGVDKLLFSQKSMDSNILSAYEIIRLNPQAMKIHQVKGQYQFETQSIKPIEGDLRVSVEHYIALLSSFSGKKVHIADNSINKVANLFSQILAQSPSNRILRLDTNREKQIFVHKIIQNANLTKQYTKGLFNKGFQTNFIIDDLSMTNETTQYLRSLIQYKSIQTGKQTFKCEEYRFLSSTQQAQIPRFIQNKCFLMSIHFETNLELYSVFRTQSNPYQHMMMSILKSSVEFIPQFLPVISELQSFISLFKGIYSTKSSEYDKFEQIYKSAKQFSNLVKEICEFYNRDPDYSLYDKLQDNWFRQTIQNFQLELEQNHSLGQRQMNLLLGKLVSTTLYAPEHEFKNIEQCFKEFKQDSNLNIDDIWKQVSSEEQSILEFSLQRLSRLNQIFKIVEQYVPFAFLKTNMSHSSLRQALKFFGRIYDWETDWIELVKFDASALMHLLKRFIIDQLRSKLIILVIHRQDDPNLKVITDFIDEFGTQVRMVMLYNKRPQIKYFQQIFSISKDIPASPTIYELKFKNHFKAQTKEYEKLIHKNDRWLVYRILFELDIYVQILIHNQFDRKEEIINSQGIYADAVRLTKQKLETFETTLAESKKDIEKFNVELEKNMTERSTLIQKLQLSRKTETKYSLQEEDIDFDEPITELSNQTNDQRETELQDKYILYAQFLQGASFDNLGSLVDPEVNCFIYHTLILYLSGEKNIPAVANDQQFTKQRKGLIETFKLFINDPNIIKKLNRMLSVKLNLLPREVREIFENSRYFVLQDKSIFESSQAAMCIWNIVQTISLIVEDRVIKERNLIKLTKQVSSIEQGSSKTSVETKLLMIQLLNLERYLQMLREKQENSLRLIDKITLDIVDLKEFMVTLQTTIKYSHVANKYFYDMEDRQRCLFTIALYVVLQSIESKHKIKIDNATEQLSLLSWTIQQQPLYFKIYEQIDQIDSVLVDKLCLLNLLLQIRLPFVMVYDNANLVLQLLKIEKYNYQIEYFSQKLNQDFKGELLVAIDPSAEFIDDVAGLMEKICIERSKYYKMEKINKQLDSTIPDYKVGYNILIVCTDRPKKVQQNFIHISLNDPYPPSSHQRLLGLFVHNFKSDVKDQLIKQQQQSETTLYQQEKVLNDYIFLISVTQPGEFEALSFLRRFRHDLFETKYKDICKNFYDQRQSMRKEIRQSASYKYIQNEEQQKGKKYDGSMGTVNLIDEIPDCKEELQPFVRGEKIQFIKFMKKKYLKDRYFYPIQGLQLVAHHFLEITGFLMFLKKLLKKLSDQFPQFKSSETFFWLTIRETIRNIKNYFDQIDQDFIRMFAQLVIMQIVSIYPKDIQRMVYVTISFKYLKSIGQMDIFFRNFLLQGYMQNQGELLEFKEFFFPEQLVLQPSIFQINKRQQNQKDIPLLKRHIRQKAIKQDESQDEDVSIDMIKPKDIPSHNQRDMSYPSSELGSTKHTRRVSVYSFEDDEQSQKSSTTVVVTPTLTPSYSFQEEIRDDIRKNRGSIRFQIFNELKGQKVNTPSIASPASNTSTPLKIGSSSLREKRMSQIGQLDLQQVELLKNQICINFMEGKKTFTNVRVSDDRLKVVLDKFIRGGADEYKMEFKPLELDQTLRNLIFLSQNSKLANILDNYLQGIEEDQWNRFCFTPVSMLKDQMQELTIPLPNSVDAQNLSIVEMLLLFKLLKPAALSASVEGILGAQLLTDIYFPGKDNIDFLGTTFRNVVFIFYQEPIINQIISTFQQVQFKIFTFMRDTISNDIKVAAEKGFWVILMGDIDHNVNLQELVGEIESVQKENFRVWILINQNVASTLPREFMYLLESSHKMIHQPPESLKERFQEVFWSEIQSLKLTEETQKVETSSPIDIHSIVIQKEQGSVTGLHYFTKSIKEELKYNLIFTLKVLKEKNCFEWCIGEREFRQILENILSHLENFGSHPYVVVYKLILMFLDHVDDSHKQGLFKIFSRFIFKTQDEEIQVVGKNEFSSYKLSMFKFEQDDDPIELLDRFSYSLNERGLIDMVGMTAYEDCQRHFLQSQNLIKNLNMFYFDKKKKSNKITKQKYLSREIKRQMQKLNGLLIITKEKLQQIRQQHFFVLMDDFQQNFNTYVQLRQVESHMKAIQEVDFEDPNLVNKITKFKSIFNYIALKESKLSNNYDLSMYYDPSHFLFSYLAGQRFILKSPYHKMRVVCEKVQSLKLNEFYISGLFVVNAHLNLLTDLIEDGNQYVDKLPLPLLKLETIPYTGEMSLPLISLEFKYQNTDLIDEYEHQARQNICGEVSFQNYLEEARSSRSQSFHMAPLEEQIYIISLPLRLKGPQSIQGKFFFKSAQPQSYWTLKNSHITN